MFGQHRATQEGCSGGHTPYRLGVAHNGHHSWQYTTSQAGTHAADDLCDIKDVTGDFPAVIGFDLRGLNHKALTTMTWLIQRANQRGNIVTLSWHQHNPISGASVYTTDDHHGVDVSNIISRILVHGDHNDVYRKELDVIAEWAKQLVDSHGNLIPVLFRPYHEMNGQWFWWGTNPVTNNTVADYKKLFQYTVTYLRDTKGVHNFLYAFSPSKPHSNSDYLRFYPGDNFVDVMGMDFYYSRPFHPSVQTFLAAVQVVTEVATAHDKIAAITEVGISNNGIETHHKFWNDHILEPLKGGTNTLKVAYMLTWTNACLNGYTIYVPFNKHASTINFRLFYNDSVTVFGYVLSDHSQAIIG
ncbi:hypothetical protein ACF0H5_022402 [Mactra antiquata]